MQKYQTPAAQKLRVFYFVLLKGENEMAIALQSPMNCHLFLPGTTRSDMAPA